MVKEKGLNNQLLDINQEMLPEKVKRTVAFLKKNKISYTLSRNKDAYSCTDAAQKRYRDGEEGIPLSDELKTYFGEYRVSKKEKHLILINLSGNNRINFKKIRSILKKSKGIRLAGKETMDLFSIQYGEVNPFLIYEIFYNSKIPSIYAGLTILFDSGLSEKKTTMMTNAGELSWAIEFNIKEVIHQFPKTIHNISLIKIVENEN